MSDRNIYTDAAGNRMHIDDAHRLYSARRGATTNRHSPEHTMERTSTGVKFNDAMGFARGTNSNYNRDVSVDRAGPGRDLYYGQSNQARARTAAVSNGYGDNNSFGESYGNSESNGVPLGNIKRTLPDYKTFSASDTTGALLRPGINTTGRYVRGYFDRTSLIGEPTRSVDLSLTTSRVAK